MITRAELVEIHRRCRRALLLRIAAGVVLVFVWQLGIFVLMQLFPDLENQTGLMLMLLGGQILPFFWMIALAGRTEATLAAAAGPCPCCGNMLRGSQEIARTLRFSRCPTCCSAILAGETPHSEAAISRWQWLIERRAQRRRATGLGAVVLLCCAIAAGTALLPAQSFWRLATLLPGLIGAILALCGLALILRRGRAGIQRAGGVAILLVLAMGIACGIACSVSLVLLIRSPASP